jgi:phosphotransferase system enzyme I (PtsI)
VTERRLSGTGVTPLSGVGRAVWYAPDLDTDDPPDGGSIDPSAELARFESARADARAAIEADRERAAEQVGEAEAAVFDAHVQFLDDPQVTAGVEDEIDAGAAAEQAVERTFAGFIEQFEASDGRMSDRADDLRDVRDRLVRALSGADGVDLAALPAGSVILAERLTPSDTAKLDPNRVAGFATVAGGRTSHAAIFARSLAIPAVVGVGEPLRDVEGGASVAVDGVEDTVVIDPDPETRTAAASDDDHERREAPATTTDGTSIEVAANVGTVADLEPAVESGADGIGLLRTEFLFLDRSTPPTEDEQYRAYRRALEAFPDDRVVVRTLDAGGDKRIDFLELPDEENPFLGERGVRRSLGPDASLFETQLRALLRAARDFERGEGGLSVMLPFVTTVEEVRTARETFSSVAAALDVDDADRPEFGVMVETPAAALLADAIVDHVEFFSIGTNDLTQYVMAAERGNGRVEPLTDDRQPAVLRAIQATVEAAESEDVWVGMCGEMAGDPDLTPLLVGLGIDELSMSPVAVPRVKQAVTDVRDADARALAERALAASTSDEVAQLIEAYRS